MTRPEPDQPDPLTPPINSHGGKTWGVVSLPYIYKRERNSWAMVLYVVWISFIL
jgi:hypothetical protein